jgi:hypothetical protein
VSDVRDRSSSLLLVLVTCLILAFLDGCALGRSRAEPAPAPAAGPSADSAEFVAMPMDETTDPEPPVVARMHCHLAPDLPAYHGLQAGTTHRYWNAETRLRKRNDESRAQLRFAGGARGLRGPDGGTETRRPAPMEGPAPAAHGRDRENMPGPETSSGDNAECLRRIVDALSRLDPQGH